MKKKLFITALIILNVFAFSKTYRSISIEKNTTKTKNLSEIIRNSDNKFTDLFFTTGVSSIEIDKKTFKFKTHKGFIYENTSIDLSTYIFEYDENTIKLNGSKIWYEKDSGQTFFINDGKKIAIDEVSHKELKKIDNFVLLITYFEMISIENKHKEFDLYKVNKLAGPCSPDHTVTIWGVGATEGAAEAHLFQNTITQSNYGTLIGCRSLGGVTFKDYKLVTFALQSFCCERQYPAISTTSIY